MDETLERMRILEMIDSGKISAEEGLLLLQALGAAEPNPDEAFQAVEAELKTPASIPLPDPLVAARFHDPLAAQDQRSGGESKGSAVSGETLEPAPNLPEDLADNAARWKRWWIIPLWIGVGITVVGGLLMYAAVLRSGALSLAFLCAGLPFALGLAVIVLAWGSRVSPWLHLRVQQPPGSVPQRIALSFPLPIGLGAWFVRTFGRFIPNLRDQPVEELLNAVRRTAGTEAPIHIQVDEGEDGEKVEIYIG